jgi:hypothetical protein
MPFNMSIAKKFIPLPFCDLSRSRQERQVRLISDKVAGGMLDYPESIPSCASKQLTKLDFKQEYILAVKLQGKKGTNQRALGAHMLKDLREVINANDGIKTQACIAGRDLAIAHYQSKKLQHAGISAVIMAAFAGMIVSASFQNIPGIVCCAVVCLMGLVGYSRTRHAETRLAALKKDFNTQCTPTYERFIETMKKFTVLRDELEGYQDEHDRIVVENQELNGLKSTPIDGQHVAKLRALSNEKLSLEPHTVKVGRLFDQLEEIQAQGQTTTQTPYIGELSKALDHFEEAIQTSQVRMAAIKQIG